MLSGAAMKKTSVWFGNKMEGQDDKISYPYNNHFVPLVVGGTQLIWLAMRFTYTYFCALRLKSLHTNG